MGDPDILRLLLATRWADLPGRLADHEAELHRLTDDDVDGLLLQPVGPAADPDRPRRDDVWVLARLCRTGGPELAFHHVVFVQAEAALPRTVEPDDREDLLTEALSSGLIVTSRLGRPVLLDRLVDMCRAVATLARPSTQTMALVATVHSTAFGFTGDVAHADASIDAFRSVVAPPDGVGPLDGGGLTGARTALALLLAARDRAVTASDEIAAHGDLLEAIAIARAAVAEAGTPLDDRGELAVNTLLTLLAELYQVSGDIRVVDDALGIVDGLADRPPTVAQLEARVLWLRLRYERSHDATDLTRALLAVDEALTRAVTEEEAAAEVPVLRETRRHILLALSSLRGGGSPPHDRP